MTRDEAVAILDEYLQNKNLRSHCRAVEACMRSYARKFGEDEELWGVTGLLHDFDYELNGEQHHHPKDGAPILRQKGVPENIVRAILAHDDDPGFVRETMMEKACYATDTITGLIVAVALVRPNKKLEEVTTESVLKKYKDPGFSRNVNRENIAQGAALLGVTLEEHIGNCLQAMQSIHEELGL
ncbi:MAG: HDIG domain-containing metalloprotein [Patescibacteria group bacterium]|jgi:putative nucleotidyltransferase with HDIG domain